MISNELGLTVEQLKEVDRLYTEKCQEIAALEKKYEAAVNNIWIPVEEKYPDSDRYVLMSFSNFSVPVIGRYEEDEYGGAFYVGDEEESCVSQGMFVNAWKELPEQYKGE